MNRALLLIWTILVFASAPVLVLASARLWWLALGAFGSHWEEGSAYAVLAGFSAILLIVAIMEIRRLAWRWHSPMFYPAIRTLVIGPFAAWLALFLLAQPWNDERLACDHYGACTTSNHIEVGALIFMLFLSVFTFGPFLGSVFQLYSSWRIPPARFVYRWWRH
jgi:hypothetical protein